MLARVWVVAACAAAVFVAESAAFAPAVAPGLMSLRHGSARCGIAERRGVSRVVSVSMSGDEGGKSRALEIEEVLVELEGFKERIIANTKDMGGKVKEKPKEIKKQLASHPDILYIENAKAQLLAELEELKQEKS
ncbi:hypothetical protein T484DRAFT_1948158 [Baffinella frigidus]|nr:hypothetical protein T484DRAFT_1948158 [Cryptophyta sp. CCMP2293]